MPRRRTRRAAKIFNSSKPLLSLTLLASLMLLPACGGARRGDAETVRPRPAVEGVRVGPRLVRTPAIRIGLEELATSALTVRAGGGLVLIDQERNAAVSGRRQVSQISFFVEGASGEEPIELYRVQVASLSREAAAERLAAQIRREPGLPTVVRYNAQTRTWRVQVGEAPSRSEALRVERALHAAGYEETWVVRDSTVAGPARSLAAVDAGGSRIAAARTFRCAPRLANALLEVGSSRYRGALEVRAGADGRVLPINIVNMEQYLRGVVPAEMSPTSFPQLEALKAQAVAARTYAFKNRGQYARQGYDICESARCQVYRGADIEHELSDRAIRETTGEIIVYEGEPINALFTSTCGGHTEDVENVFSGDPVPYLRGVPCEPEAEQFSRLRSDEEIAVTYGSDDLPLDYEVATLKIAGVLSTGFSPEPAAQVEGGRWRLWVERATRRLGSGRTRDDSDRIAARESTPTLREAIESLVAAAGWEERISRHVTEGDVRALIDLEGAAGLDLESGRMVLYFLRLGLIAAEPDGRLAIGEPLRQTTALRLLRRLLGLEGALGTAEGNLVRAGGGTLELRSGAEVEDYEMEAGARLFKRFQSYTVPVRTLQMAPGDRVVLCLRDGRIAALVHSPPLQGIASDRDSRFYRWDVRYSPAELAESVGRFASVGRVRELRPLRYGVSERVVELEVVGDEGRAVLRGLQIRRALGLRENLFVIERIYDEMGNIAAWRFIGNGWGHGVGLCQFGASGMAIAGLDYRQILQHYYSGVQIEKRY